jgi:hypothetical protein
MRFTLKITRSKWFYPFVPVIIPYEEGSLPCPLRAPSPSHVARLDWSARSSYEVPVNTSACPSAGDLRNSDFTGKRCHDGLGVPHLGCLVFLYPFSDPDALLPILAFYQIFDPTAGCSFSGEAT